MGAYIVCFARMLRVPLITVAHTVHEFLNKNEHGSLVRMFQASHRLVVMTELGKRYLHMFHNIPNDPKLAVIPHGVPELERLSLSLAQSKWDLTGRVLLSSGLIHPGKGMHDVLLALPNIMKSVKNITYVIAGEAHPNCGRPCSDYVIRLQQIVRDLKLQPYVRFVDRYLTTDELHTLIQVLFLPPLHLFTSSCHSCCHHCNRRLIFISLHIPKLM
jgi:glycosyltransferase involved in cell wall biosynthesis